MTRREWVFTIIAAVCVALSMYQCGAAANDRALKDAALDSLEVSRAERHAVRGQLSQERMLRELADIQVEGLIDSVGRLERRSTEIASAARVLRDRSTEQLVTLQRQHARDTASMVPRVRLDSALEIATDATTAAHLAESARSLLADSAAVLRARADSIARAGVQLLRAAADSAAAHLAREHTRAPTVVAGVQAGSDRCGWGPWDLMPCVTRKVAFVGGVVIGAVVAKNSDQVINFVKKQF